MKIQNVLKLLYIAIIISILFVPFEYWLSHDISFLVLMKRYTPSLIICIGFVLFSEYITYKVTQQKDFE